MLLRSSSAPLPNSRLTYCKDYSSSSSSPEPESILHLPKSTSSSIIFSLASSSDGSMNKMSRTLSETDLKELKKPSTTTNKSNCICMHGLLSAITVEEEEDETADQMLSLFSNTKGLNLQCEAHVEARMPAGEVLLVGGGSGSGGGRICHGGGWSDGGDGDDDGGDGSDYWDSDHRHDSTDVYYQRMIEANPTNSLLLSNYARYLKEVLADFEKAEEYCGRALQANPGDGQVLSLYADLIWETHKDSTRAQIYFDRALKAAPQDCYIAASYARFLWDADDDEEEELELQAQGIHEANGSRGPPSIAAAS